MVSRRLLRIKVLKELYAYMSGSNNSLLSAEKELIGSLNKSLELYQYLFYFLPELQNLAQAKIDKGLQKHRPSKDELAPNTRFVDNKVILQIAQQPDLLRYANQHSVQFQEAQPIIKKMLNNIVERDYFKQYMEQAECSFAQDKELVINILTYEFEGFEDVDILLEEQNIFWTDEMELMIVMVIRTVTNMKEAHAFRLPALYKNELDEQFPKRLFRNAVQNYDDYYALIGRFTPNWDVERIAFMDILILIQAVSEIKEFRDIPIKVSLDEYIELARFYSTNNSSTFVNGVLDKVVQYFNENRIISKQAK